MALIILSFVSVLGYAMGWMQVRGADIFSELIRKQPLDMLMDQGLGTVKGALGSSCTPPPDFTRRIVDNKNILGSGWINVHIELISGGLFLVKAVGVQGTKVQERYCKVTCLPAASCPEGMTPEACAGGGGGEPVFQFIPPCLLS